MNDTQDKIPNPCNDKKPTQLSYQCIGFLLCGVEKAILLLVHLLIPFLQFSCLMLLLICPTLKN